jgi:multidrug efflux pump subunit AcrB
VPLSQVTDSIAVAWEDPIVWRWDRRRAITVQATPHNTTADALRNRILADFEAIELPPGYRLEWDGEYDSMTTAQEGLKPGLAPALGLMALIVVALFNAFRPPLIIACTLPFAIIGITIGLLATGNSFSFMALLGAMSLSGMMIKNAIVLLDQINLDLAAGKPPYQAVIDAAVSRLRPVILAAGTTALGVIPLLQDIFWVSMAITIMAGLIFGTLLTMVVIPVLYVIFFRVPLPQHS